MIKTELPDGWSKQINENGKFYYYNQNQNIYTKIHPLMKKFRNYYHEILM